VTFGIRFQDLKITLECTAAAVFDVYAQHMIRLYKYAIMNAMTIRIDSHVLMCFVLKRAATLYVVEPRIIPLFLIGKNFHFVCLTLLSH